MGSTAGGYLTRPLTGLVAPVMARLAYIEPRNTGSWVGKNCNKPSKGLCLREGILWPKAGILSGPPLTLEVTDISPNNSHPNEQ